MTDIDTSRAAVDRMLTGVTDGPWRYVGKSRIRGDSPQQPIAVVAASGRTHDERAANARFIAAARELVPALLARAEAAEARAERLEAALKRVLRNVDEDGVGTVLMIDLIHARAALTQKDHTDGE